MARKPVRAAHRGVVGGCVECIFLAKYRDGLAMPLVEGRFRVQQVDVAGSTIGEDKDDRPGLGGKVRGRGSQWVGCRLARLGEQPLLLEQIAQGQSCKTTAGGLQQLSPRPEAVCQVDAHVAFRKGTGFHELSDQAALRECRLVDVDKFIEVEHHMAKIG